MSGRAATANRGAGGKCSGRVLVPEVGIEPTRAVKPIGFLGATPTRVGRFSGTQRDLCWNFCERSAAPSCPAVSRCDCAFGQVTGKSAAIADAIDAAEMSGQMLPLGRGAYAPHEALRGALVAQTSEIR